MPLSATNLLRYNSLRVPAQAQYFYCLHDSDALPYLHNFAARHALQPLVIGEGNNILLRAYIPGLVICNRLRGLHWKQQGKQIVLRVGAGENMDALVDFCVKRNWHGLENLSAIPSSVGGAVVQNIGAYGKEAAEHILSVTYFDFIDGKTHTLPAEDCAFGYRTSIFQHELQNRACIIEVEWVVGLSGDARLTHKDLCRTLTPHASPAQIRSTVQRVRAAKLPDPQILPNCGSFFKNPLVTDKQLAELLEKVPHLPHFNTGNAQKISAAFLIEKAGWKGKREGDVGCYDGHSLVLVNHAHAQGEEVYQFSQKIITDIREKFLLPLEREVRVIGCAHTPETSWAAKPSTSRPEGDK